METAEQPRKNTPNSVSKAIVDAAIKVHTQLGPGLLESAYKSCLQFELQRRGHKVCAEVPVPVLYDGLQLDIGYRLDLLVDDCVVVELKSVEAVKAVHHAQVLSHLRLSGKSIGLLINFNVAHLKDGLRRFVNGRDWN